MQFPVPQFTDVEDKIIGPLTIKQFGILFGVGIIVFLAFSASKNLLVTAFVFMIFGVPGLGLAFANINGRPLYNNIGNFSKFINSQKILVFQKEAASSTPPKNMKDAELASQKTEAVPQTPAMTKSNLQKVEELLNKTQNEEKEVAGKLK